MRRGLLLILFAVAALAVSGDTRSGQIMARMASVIKGHGQYEVKFTFKADPSADPLQGRYVVSGDKYYLLVAGTEVFCDGKAKYEINTQYKEVTVDRVDPTDRRVLTNPAKVFDFPEQEFSHKHTGSATVSGRKCDVVSLYPKDTESPLVEVILNVDQATGLPVSITYRMAGVSDLAVVDISSIARAEVPASQFIFNKAKYKSFEVIDFR